jgi:hypothetical protein
MLYVFHLCFPTPFNTGEKVVSSHKVDDLYYLCLFSDLTVRSLRDLRGEHVPILKRIQKVVINGLAEKHGVASSQLLAYVALIYRTQLSTFGKSRIASLKKKGIRQPPVGFFFPQDATRGKTGDTTSQYLVCWSNPDMFLKHVQ